MRYIEFDSLKESSMLSNNEILFRTIESLKRMGLVTIPASGERKAPNFHWPQDILKYAEGSCFEFSVLLHQICEMNDIDHKLVLFGIQSSRKATLMMNRRYETVHMIPMIKDDSNRYYRIIDMTLHLDFNKYTLVSSNVVKALKEVKNVYRTSMYLNISKYYSISIDDILMQGPYVLGDNDMDTINKMLKMPKSISNSDFADKLNAYNIITDKMDENIETHRSFVSEKGDIEVVKEIEYGPEWSEAYSKAAKMLGLDKRNK